MWDGLNKISVQNIINSYQYRILLSDTVRYTDIIKTKPSRREFIYNKSYSIFIFKLRKKPGKKNMFALQKLIPHSEAYKDCMDNAINVLSPGCPASAWVLQILAPQLSIFVAKPYLLHLLQLLPQHVWKAWTSADPVVEDCLSHLLQLMHEPRDTNESISFVEKLLDSLLFWIHRKNTLKHMLQLFLMLVFFCAKMY